MHEGRWPRVLMHADAVGLDPRAALRLLEDGRFADTVNAIEDGLRAAA